MTGERRGDSQPDEQSRIPLRGRFSSGIPGLDEVLGGGLISGGIYMVTGGPGTGKTVLANQMSFARAREGHRCLYFTMLAESHSRMVDSLASFEFFDEKLLTKQVAYLSGVGALVEGGLQGFFDLLQEEIKRRQPALVVLDAFGFGPRAVDTSRLDRSSFLNRLGALLEFTGCSALVSALSRRGRVAPEQALADGLFELTQESVGLRSVRELFVTKFRGSSVLEGGHVFEIDERGIVLYPRIEAKLAREQRAPSAVGERVRFGVPKLDDMLGGGIHGGSTTGLVGPTGSGKTLLGLHFLAEGATRGERGLYCGFYESPVRVIAGGDGVGLSLSDLRADGWLDVVWQRPFESLLDRIGLQLLDHVRDRGIRRLYIDGLEGLMRGAAHPERAPAVLAALTNELRAAGVTVLLSAESNLLGRSEVPDEFWSALVENLIFLRYVEMRSHLRRLIWITKVRGSPFESVLREFTITGEGIQIAAKLDTTEARLSGTPRLDEEDGPQGPAT